MRLMLAVLALALATAPAGAQAPAVEQRWVYISTNFLVDENVPQTIALLERAAKDGYNGAAIADSKFMTWDRQPPRYFDNVRKVREACRRLHVAFIACVCPIGYSGGIMAHDPNLAEGIPVSDAPFVVRNGRLVPEDADIRLANGSFEQSQANMPAGWAFADQPGKISFVDSAVKHEGAASLRMEHIGALDPQNGHGRIMQKLKVRPFGYYHVSAWVKTEDFATPQNVKIAVLSIPQGVALTYNELGLARTRDWRQVHVTFNSLEFSEVNLYLGIWNGGEGRIWWDDVRVEPAGLVNVVRRAGTPLRVTSEDGSTVYQEGRDFDGARDPALGTVPWPGGFSIWHEQPAVSVPPGSALKDGQRARVSYYEAPIIGDSQVMCCMCEPKVYEVLKWQIEQVRKSIEPDGYFMQHDEIRCQGWDDSCAATKLTPGQVLADNVRKCAAIIRAADPGKPIYVWSDMFDPFHNAKKTGRYYLVKGDGPWFGAWEGLSPDVTILNWNSNGHTRVDSMKHFAALGNKQVLAGYYDGRPAAISDWLRDAAGVQGVIGVMYTTWQHKYGDLEAFMDAVGP